MTKSSERAVSPIRDPSIAIQGVRGAFSHVAAVRVFGADAPIVECDSFEELFQAVTDGRANRGVVPVENTLVGSVQRSMDLLLESRLHVVGEVSVRVRLHLVSTAGSEIASVRRVASHPVALQQCRRFLSQHPHMEAVPVFDTAGSIRDLMLGSADYTAAIGSELAATLYGAETLASGIEDNEANYTRFLIVTKEELSPPPEGTKTSLILTLAHRPGALAAALDIFARRGINLTRLTSRPVVGRPGEYSFYIDLSGSSTAEHNMAVEALREITLHVRVLGTYPVGD